MEIGVSTGKRSELIDITDKIRTAVKKEKLKNGTVMVFVPHTTAAVTINENADPDVERDLIAILDRMIPWEGGYRHMEGNSAAHMKTSLVGSSELIQVRDGELVLGRWQGVFFCEFDGPRSRKLHINFLK